MLTFKYYFDLYHFPSQYVPTFTAMPHTKNNNISVFSRHIFYILLVLKNIFTLTFRAMARIIKCEHKCPIPPNFYVNYTTPSTNIQLSKCGYFVINYTSPDKPPILFLSTTTLFRPNPLQISPPNILSIASPKCEFAPKS